jgi:hypothetical protein
LGCIGHNGTRCASASSAARQDARATGASRSA